MAVKIKNLHPTKKKLRMCFICRKMKDMELDQRFCSPACKHTANEVDKFGVEFKVSLSKK